MAKSKASDYVTSEAVAPQENYGSAIAQKAQQVIGRQVEGAVQDIQTMEGIRANAIDQLSARIASVVDPDLFTGDLYDAVASRLKGQTLAYRHVFGEVVIDVEPEPQRERVSVSDFLALPPGGAQELGGYQPLSIEGSTDDDYQV